MNSAKKPKILLVPDTLDWALGTVAREIVRCLEGDFDFKIFTSAKIKSKKEQFDDLCKKTDIVHYLTQFGYDDSVNHHGKPVLRKIEWPKVNECQIKIARDCDAITAFCKLDADSFRDAEFTVIECRHGVDADLFKPEDRVRCRGELGISEDLFVIGFVGATNSSGSKKYKAIEKFVEVVRHIPGAIVLIIGSRNDEFCMMLKSAGVKHIALGEKAHGEMAGVYSAMDVYLATSWAESGPMPVLEAMSCGIPVVGTPVGQIPELVTPGKNGWIADDIHGLIHGLGIVRGSCRNMGLAARKVTMEWPWSRGIEPLREAYKNIYESNVVTRPRVKTVDPVRVSVLMCAYNAENHIAEAIESILSQTFEAYEFVIIDDGSTDRTAEIIKSFKDSRIKYYKNEHNIGLTRSLNAGWRLCRGEYVARQDADDVSKPTRLEKESRFLEENPDHAMCGSWFESFGNHSRIYKRPDSNINEQPLEATRGLAVGGATLRRQAVIDVGGHDENFKYAQDYKLGVDLRRSGWKIGGIPEVLYSWRVGHDHISRLQHGDQTACADRITASLGLPRVGILVIAYDRLETTRRCVEHILKNTDVEYTLYLFNNGSTDETGAYFDKCAADHEFIHSFHSETNLGCPGGRAFMMREIDNEYVAWIDNDMLVSSGWLLPLIVALDTDPNVAAASAVYDQEGKKFQQGAYSTRIELSGDHVKFVPYQETEALLNLDDTPYFSGGASLLRRMALNWAYSWGDQDIGIAEDLYISLHLTRAGYRMCGVEESRAEHVPREAPNFTAYRKRCPRGTMEVRNVVDTIRREFGINVIRNNGWTRLCGARILLIFPPPPAPNEISFGLPPPTFPQGLGFVGAFLGSINQNVRIIDYRVENPDLEAEIKAFNPDWVGVYTTTIGWHRTVEFLNRLRGFTQSPIVVGGPHATLFPESVPTHIDHIVCGEGERAFWQLVDGKINDRIIGASRLEDLDLLPWPDWKMFVDKPYACTDNEGFGMTDMATMNTSRGCPFMCGFCSSRKILTRRYTAMSPDKVGEGAAQLKKLGYKTIYFREDNFTANAQRAIDVSSVMNRLDIKFAAESRVDTLDNSALHHMASMGLVGLYVGVESGSQRILDAMGKGISVEQTERFFKMCHKNRIKTYASVIVGYPGETESDLVETDRILEKISPDKVCKNVYIGMPGSDDAARMKESGEYEHIDECGIVYPVGYSVNVARYYKTIKAPYGARAG